MRGSQMPTWYTIHLQGKTTALKAQTDCLSVSQQTVSQWKGGMREEWERERQEGREENGEGVGRGEKWCSPGAEPLLLGYLPTISRIFGKSAATVTESVGLPYCSAQ